MRCAACGARRLRGSISRILAGSLPPSPPLSPPLPSPGKRRLLVVVGMRRVSPSAALSVVCVGTHERRFPFVINPVVWVGW
jgi:hypothetical protein